MRTTLTIDDDIARQLGEIVHRSGKPFKNVVTEASAAFRRTRWCRPISIDP